MMKPEFAKLYAANRDAFSSLTDDQIMGLTIKAEAEGECREGRIAIGTVILERVDHRKWDGQTIREVCLWPLQFSCYNFGDYRNRLIDIAHKWDEYYRLSRPMMECANIALEMIHGTLARDPDLSAVHCCQYLNPKVAPEARAEWIAGGMKSIKMIGKHEFFV